MNYIETFLSKLGLNYQSESSCEENSPNESGQFQVIDCDEDFIDGNLDKQKQTQTIFTTESKQKPKNSSSDDQYEDQKFKSEGPVFNGQKQCDKQTLQLKQSVQLKKQQNNISHEYPLVNLKPSKGSASTIQLDEYYMIVSSEQLKKKFVNEQDWESFYAKINLFNSQAVNLLNLNVSVGCSSSIDKKKQKISLNLTQLNSILQIQSHELQKRTSLWNHIARPPIDIKFKYNELANKKDPKKLQQNVNKILITLVPQILTTIHNEKLKSISNVQDELQIWKSHLIKLLTFYGANDKQIGYSKGLEYIALGILVAKPLSNQKNLQMNTHPQSTQNSESQEQSPQGTIFKQTTYAELQTHFKYLLFTKQLRNMYFPGTPKLYQEIHLLTEQMKNEVPDIISKLQQMKVDFVKLFINYYKTFLLYKIKNPEVIRKIMEFLLIYGIDIVRIILTRIMNRNEKKILQIQQQMELLKYIAESLVDSYFGQADSVQVITKFKHLFIFDTCP